MKNRIWIKAEGLQLYNPVVLKALGQLRICLRVGIEGFSVEGLIFNLHSDGYLIQNWAYARCRLNDNLFSHLYKKMPDNLLPEVLSRALRRRYLEGQRRELFAFIKGGREKPDFSFFKPAEWQDRSLKIPVEYIMLSGFKSPFPRGSVRADIRVGHHLLFKEVLVCKRESGIIGYSDTCIQDRRVIAVINALLLQPKMETLIKNIFYREEVEQSTLEMYTAVPDCNPSKPPPPVKFE